MTGLLVAVMLLAASLGAAGPAGAEPQGSRGHFVEPNAGPVPTSVGEFSVPFGSGSSVRVVYEGSRALDKTGDELSKPMISIGFGWFVYVYLSRSDWQLMVRFGVGAATLWLAGKLALTGFGPYAAMAAGVIVSRYVFRWTAPRSGCCRDIKFPYGTAWPVGLKDVRRSC
ncbi:MAG TPA: hypothetical protein ENG98_03435 [Actinobacteria bacterium]|nr:hypothetical protein [Actinomycetota bacterium]